MRRLLCILSVLVIGLSGSRAYACLGPFDETQTFLTAIPFEAVFERYVGAVEIIDVHVGKKDQPRLTRVKTTRTYKGEPPGETFLVKRYFTSCTRDFSIQVGQEFFLAGKFENNVFSGTWKGLSFNKYWAHEAPDSSE